MSKVINMDTLKKEEKLQEIFEQLESLKDAFAEVIDVYEDEDADSQIVDTLIEAMDALEDAYDGIEEVIDQEV